MIKLRMWFYNKTSNIKKISEFDKLLLEKIKDVDLNKMSRRQLCKILNQHYGLWIKYYPCQTKRYLIRMYKIHVRGTNVDDLKED